MISRNSKFTAATQAAVLALAAVTLAFAPALAGCGDLLYAESGLAQANASGDASTSEGGRAEAYASAESTATDGGSLADGRALPTLDPANVYSTDAGAVAPPPYVFVPTVAAPNFVDDFARSDAPAIGNGWFEKVPAALSLTAGGVRLDSDALPWDSLVLRPEAILNVEVSATFTLGSTNEEVSLYARAQSNAVTLGQLSTYRLRVSAASCGIQNMYRDAVIGSVAQYATSNVTPSLLVGTAYRMVLRVRGADPVLLEGGLFRLDGTLIASLRGQDASAYRFVGAGRVGFGARDLGTRIDDFTRKDL